MRLSLRLSSRICSERDADHEDREERHHAEGEEGDHLVVGASVGADAVGGHRRRGRSASSAARPRGRAEVAGPSAEQRAWSNVVIAPLDRPPHVCLEAILLGIVQGFTEFLPISSSGHLILVPWLQDYTFLQENESFNKTFDVALHLGTLVAVVSYFWSDLGRMLSGWFRTPAAALDRDRGRAPRLGGGGRDHPGGDRRRGWARTGSTSNLGEPWMIAIALIFFGLLLGVADRRPQEETVCDISLKQGLILGIAQSLALSPGHLQVGDHDHGSPLHGHRP